VQYQHPCFRWTFADNGSISFTTHIVSDSSILSKLFLSSCVFFSQPLGLFIGLIPTRYVLYQHSYIRWTFADNDSISCTTDCMSDSCILSRWEPVRSLLLASGIFRLVVFSKALRLLLGLSGERYSESVLVIFPSCCDRYRQILICRLRHKCRALPCTPMCNFWQTNFARGRKLAIVIVHCPFSDPVMTFIC
jgi:hypothetical protein